MLLTSSPRCPRTHPSPCSLPLSCHCPPTHDPRSTAGHWPHATQPQVVCPSPSRGATPRVPGGRPGAEAAGSHACSAHALGACHLTSLSSHLRPAHVPPTHLKLKPPLAPSRVRQPLPAFARPLWASGPRPRTRALVDWTFLPTLQSQGDSPSPRKPSQSAPSLALPRAPALL